MLKRTLIVLLLLCLILAGYYILKMPGSLTRKPDLVIYEFEVLGQPNINQNGDMEVPVKIIVGNRGSCAAGIFKISTMYSGPMGTYIAPLHVPGQVIDDWFAFSDVSLEAGSEMSFEGKAAIPQLRSCEITLWAVVDSCIAEDNMPKYCRVDESNEDNNVSKEVVFYLP
jgi:hypothetical protein